MKKVIYLANDHFDGYAFDDDFVISRGKVDVTYGNFKRALGQINISKGEPVVFHSDLLGLRNIGDAKNRDELADFFIKALLDCIGNEGLLVVPVFTYSFCRSEEFDPLSADSRIGLIPSRILKWKKICRSTHPIFSYAALGTGAEEFLAGEVEKCFSEGSFQRKLFSLNPTFFFLGKLGLQMCTAVHAIEQSKNVPYRYTKHFGGNILLNGQAHSRKVEYLVRDLDINPVPDFASLRRDLDAKGASTQCRLGQFELYQCKAQEIWKTASDGLDRDSKYLIKD